MLSPMTQHCAEEHFYVQSLLVQAISLVHMGQEILESSRAVQTLAQAVKTDAVQLSEEITRTTEDAEQDVIFHLYKTLPRFAYYIQAIPDIKRIIFKRRQLRMTFRVFNSLNVQSQVPGKVLYTIKTYTCTSPYHEIAVTSTGTPIIVGETVIEAENQSNFEFFNICFTAGSSKYPHGYFNLVIMSLNNPLIEPLVVEKVNVRLKYRKVMIMKNRRKKLCLQQQAQVYELESK